MAEYYRFFDSIDGTDERYYTADEFAEYFRQVISSGILNGGNNLQVTCDGTNMDVSILPGYAWLEGYLYKIADEPLVLTLDAAHSELDRIDRVVIRLDKRLEHRYVKAFILKGEPAEEPSASAITRDENIYELSLAQVRVIGGKSFIEGGEIIDERLNTEVCGLANSLVTADTTDIFNQFQHWFNTKVDEWAQNIAGFEQDWNDWFSQQQTEGFVMAVEKGAANGVASLDENATVPLEQLPDLTTQELIGKFEVENGESVTAGDVVRLVNGKIKPVKPSGTMSFSEIRRDFQSYYGSNVDFLSICTIDESRFLLVYKISSHSGIEARIGTMDALGKVIFGPIYRGTTVTNLMRPKLFDIGTYGSYRVFVLMFGVYSGDYRVSSIMIRVHSTSGAIYIDSVKVLKYSTNQHVFALEVIKVSDDKIILLYYADNSGHAAVYTVNTSGEIGTSPIYQDSVFYYNFMKSIHLDSNRYLSVGKDSSNNLCATIITIDEVTGVPSFGEKQIIQSSVNDTEIGVVPYLYNGKEQVLICYYKQDSSRYVYFRGLEITDGDSIFIGEEKISDDYLASGGRNLINAFGSSFLVTDYYHPTNQMEYVHVYKIVLSSDNTITTTQVFSQGSDKYMSNRSYYNAILVGDKIIYSCREALAVIHYPADFSKVIGISKGNGSGGETIEVSLGNYLEGPYVLEKEKNYYCSSVGRPSLQKGPIYLGRAITTTSLLKSPYKPKYETGFWNAYNLTIGSTYTKRIALSNDNFTQGRVFISGNVQNLGAIIHFNKFSKAACAITNPTEATLSMKSLLKDDKIPLYGLDGSGNEIAIMDVYIDDTDLVIVFTRNSGNLYTNVFWEVW